MAEEGCTEPSADDGGFPVEAIAGGGTAGARGWRPTAGEGREGGGQRQAESPSGLCGGIWTVLQMEGAETLKKERPVTTSALGTVTLADVWRRVAETAELDQAKGWHGGRHRPGRQAYRRGTGRRVDAVQGGREVGRTAVGAAGQMVGVFETWCLGAQGLRRRGQQAAPQPGGEQRRWLWAPTADRWVGTLRCPDVCVTRTEGGGRTPKSIPLPTPASVQWGERDRLTAKRAAGLVTLPVGKDIAYSFHRHLGRPCSVPNMRRGHSFIVSQFY